MLDYGFPVLYALGLWWFSTGLVLYLDNLPGRTFGWTMLGGAAVLAVALFAMVISSTSTSTAAAYLGFTAGVAVWGVLEMSYFTGFVTGPRKTPCPQSCSGWRRFRLAILTSLYHELAVLAAVGFLILISWGEPNRVGAWAFVVLWLMRWSAKLNLFLGVPNLNDWLPDHLAYLKTYMPKRSMNLLFPVSVTLPTVIVVLLVSQALEPEAAGFSAVGLILVATLLALGILEHWFLVLPLPDEALWAWALPPRQNETDQAPKASVPETPGQKTIALRQRAATRAVSRAATLGESGPRSRVGSVSGS